MSKRLASSLDALQQSELESNTLIPCRYKEGTSYDTDRSIRFDLFQSSPVAKCDTTSDTATKTATVENFPDFSLTNGREVVVFFSHHNETENPTFNLNGTGSFQLTLENQKSGVDIGDNCWGDNVWLTLKYVDITVGLSHIQKWIILGHDIASQDDESIKYADGTIAYSKAQTDSAISDYSYSKDETDSEINGALTDLNTYSTTEKVVGTWIDGKPVYELTFEKKQSMSSGFEIMDITNKEIISVIGTVINNSGTILPIPYSNNTYCIFYEGLNNKLKLGGNGYPITYIRCIIRYKKTTD